MTRWDCDVKLWRGVPCSFPAFYGWPAPVLDVVRASTASLRYICCPTCYQWIPESWRFHACLSTPELEADANNDAHSYHSSASADNSDLNEKPNRSVYVKMTDENSDDLKCSLCFDRMRMDFLHDIEEWVFADCVEHEGVVIHEFCRDAVYG